MACCLAVATARASQLEEERIPTALFAAVTSPSAVEHCSFFEIDKALLGMLLEPSEDWFVIGVGRNVHGHEFVDPGRLHDATELVQRSLRPFGLPLRETHDTDGLVSHLGDHPVELEIRRPVRSRPQLHHIVEADALDEEGHVVDAGQAIGERLDPDCLDGDRRPAVRLSRQSNEHSNSSSRGLHHAVVSWSVAPFHRGSRWPARGSDWGNIDGTIASRGAPHRPRRGERLAVAVVAMCDDGESAVHDATFGPWGLE